MMGPEMAEANLGSCWHEGKEIEQNEEGLIIHETKTEGPNSRDANEPDYSVDKSFRTGNYGSNPWREK